MSESMPKSSELLQAQAAAFAAEQIEHDADKAYLFDNLGNLAASDVRDVVRVTDKAEHHLDKNGEKVSIPEGTERVVARGEDYVNFLRSAGGSRSEAVQGRADILKAYSVFAPAVAKLKDELTDPATRKKHPAYLGNGSNSTVVEISTGDKQYAVRIPNEKGADLIDTHLAGAVLAEGIPRLEQVVAASYEDGVTISEKMPGKEVGYLTVGEMNAITDVQLGELFDTLITARERGVGIDAKPSNFFYDTEAGFGVIDYHSSRLTGKVQELNRVVGLWPARAICNMGFPSRGYKPVKTSEDYARNLEIYKAQLEVVNRYRAVAERKLTGEEREAVLRDIDSAAESPRTMINYYSDSAWVAKNVAQSEELDRQQAVRANGAKSDTDELLSSGPDIIN